MKSHADQLDQRDPQETQELQEPQPNRFQLFLHRDCPTRMPSMPSNRLSGVLQDVLVPKLLETMKNIVDLL